MNPYSNLPYRNVYSQLFGSRPPVSNNPYGDLQWGDTSPLEPSQIEPSQIEPPDPYKDELDRLYNGRSPASEAHQRSIASMPTREGNRPSKWHYLAAALGGTLSGMQEGVGRGMETTRGILEAPYQRAYSDWAARNQGLEHAASIENQGVARRLEYIKMKQQEAKDKVTLANQTMTAEASRDRAKAAGQPRYQPTIVGDNAYAFNPITGQIGNPLGESPAFRAQQATRNNLGVSDALSRGRLQLGDTLERGRMELGAGLTRDTHRSNRQFDAANPVTPGRAYSDAPDSAAVALADRDYTGLFRKHFNMGQDTNSPKGVWLQPTKETEVEHNAFIKLVDAYSMWLRGNKVGRKPQLTDYKPINLGDIK